MNLGYYPGCSLEGSAKEFNQSLKATLQALEVQLSEIDDWSCCGASSAHSANHLLALALPARNLLLAKKQGMSEIVAPCAACYNRLAVTRHELNNNETARKGVEDLLETPYSDGMQILNLVQLFHHIGLPVIKEKIKRQMSFLKPACYYGCLLVRPNNITGFDDAEHPTAMEQVVEITGTKAVDWNFKVECCGASHSIAHTKIVEKLSKNKLPPARCATRTSICGS
ncbi:MAG: heterodisulfide reductase subunit B [Ignavibacteriales bacterium]|nr:heterodisulfide reductase subunit B [Ignavibacteriales bacterium]